MTDTEKLFLACLGDFLNGNKTTVSGEIDLPLLIRYAKTHDVSGIIYNQLKPAPLSESFNRAYLHSFYDFVNRNKFLTEVKAAFNGAGINFILFKGFSISKYYPVPELRTMGDCDILVHPEDRDKAADIMRNLGFSDDGRRDMELHFKKGGLEFELHRALLYDEEVNTATDKAFCKKVWNYAVPVSPEFPFMYELDADFQLVYLLLHLKKHLLNKGAGFRMFMDIMLFYRNAPIDRDRLNAFLKETGLERFFAVCLELCGRWFCSAYDYKIFDQSFFENVTKEIFSNGVYGFEAHSPDEFRMLNTVRRKGKLRTVIESIFPPYQSFRYVSYYSFVDNRPYLLPIAWIYRFYRAVRYGKLADSKEHAKQVINSDAELNIREATLKIWGI